MWLLFSVAVFLLLLHENTPLLRPVFKATLSTLLRAQQQDDIFSKFVKSFLPKPSVFGLSQYNESTKPENYLANKYERALLLPSDTKIGGAGLAQIDDGRGPQFSPEGLNINLSSAAPKRVTIKLGLYYERDNDGSNTFLPNKLRTEDLSMLKVYGGVYAENEKIPYSDAMPFQIN